MTQPPHNLPARVITDEVSALLGENKRTGPWTPGSTTLVKATLAEVTLDLREAVLPDGEELCFDVEVLLGYVTITVPPGWSVIQEVELFLGSYEEDEDPERGTAEQVVRITGRIRLGGVIVHRRHRGENKRDAKRRRRALRKAAKNPALPPAD